jgi:hypothetical protein
MKTNKRRDLSGIYIFDKFDGEPKRQPTCFEDCQEATQDAWLDSLSKEALKNLAKKLGDTIRVIGNQFNITAKNEEDD